MTFLGSPVLWILAIMAVVTIITYFERWLDLRRAQIDSQDFLKGVINVLAAGNDAEALAICDDVGAPVANVVAAAIRHRAGSDTILREAVDSQGRSEVSRLDRRLASLAIIAQIAPSIGLIGTIIGFMRAVLLVNAQTVVSRADLLNVTMDSLVIAAAGLTVSVIASVMYGALRVRLERVIVEMETAASQIVGYLSTAELEQKESSK